jgi:hypothetical protein
MAILALALITASLIAAYSSTNAEVVANSAMRAQNRAYQLAETALQQFLLRRSEVGFCTNCVTNPAQADSEWTRLTLPGGYATVVATRVRPNLGTDRPALFFIRSTGVDTSTRFSGSGHVVFATRAVGQYATFGTATIKPLAALSSLNGVSNVASLPPTSGLDACGVRPAIAGIVVPQGGQYHSFASYSAQGTHIPPLGSPRVDSSQVLDTLKNRVGIDWNAILNQNAIPVDVMIPPGSWPSNSAFNDTSYWPVIRVKTSVSLPRTGRGILIVDSNLALQGSRRWDGIILVGGTLLSTSADTVAGAVVTGLNRTLPNAVAPAPNTYQDNDIVYTAPFIAYNSCKAGRAAERLKLYFAWSNTWMDNVAVW